MHISVFPLPPSLPFAISLFFAISTLASIHHHPTHTSSPSSPLPTSIPRHLSHTSHPLHSQLNGLSSRRSSPVDTLSSVTWIARTTAPSSEHQHQQPPYPTHHYRPRRLLDKTTLSTLASREEQELAAIQPSLVQSSLAKIKPKQQ